MIHNTSIREELLYNVVYGGITRRMKHNTSIREELLYNVVYGGIT